MLNPSRIHCPCADLVAGAAFGAHRRGRDQDELDGNIIIKITADYNWNQLKEKIFLTRAHISFMSACIARAQKIALYNFIKVFGGNMDSIEIYEDLKEKIIWLDVSPDSTLNQTELAETYGVSRNPITIALTRLDAEDWVIRHGSHFVVSPLTLVRMREITEIRSVLEIQANLWAMHRISKEGLDELRALGTEIKKLSPRASNREMVRLDFNFHKIIYRETQNHQLAKMLEKLLNHYLRFWLSGPQEINKESLFHDTLEMIKAIENKDELSMRASTAAHIKASLEKIMSIA